MALVLKDYMHVNKEKNIKRYNHNKGTILGTINKWRPNQEIQFLARHGTKYYKLILKMKVFARVQWRWFLHPIPQHCCMKNECWLHVQFCFALCFISKFPLQILCTMFVSKFPSKWLTNIFVQIFETTSLAKLSHTTKSNNSAISMIKSWKFHVLSCMCKLSCVG